MTIDYEANAEQDRQSCLAMAYPVGTVCLLFGKGKEILYPGKGHWIHDDLKVKIREAHLETEWADKTQGKVNYHSFDIEKITYDVICLAQMPFLEEGGVLHEVADLYLLSMDEIGSRKIMDRDIWKCVSLKNARYKRKFTRVALYDGTTRRGWYPSDSRPGESVQDGIGWWSPRQ